jgi:hypothetical protein
VSRGSCAGCAGGGALQTRSAGTSHAPLRPRPPPAPLLNPLPRHAPTLLPPRRALYEFGQYSFLAVYRDSTGLNFSNFSDKGNGMSAVFAILIIEWFVFMGLAYYLEQVLSSGGRPGGRAAGQGRRLRKARGRGWGVWMPAMATHSPTLPAPSARLTSRPCARCMALQAPASASTRCSSWTASAPRPRHCPPPAPATPTRPSTL